MGRQKSKQVCKNVNGGIVSAEVAQYAAVKGKQMERKMLLDETTNIRRSILAHNAKLIADKSGFVPGRLSKEEDALNFALHLLEHAELVFESDQCQAITSMGIAIGIMVDRGLVVLEPDTQPDLLLMKSANVLPV